MNKKSFKDLLNYYFQWYFLVIIIIIIIGIFLYYFLPYYIEERNRTEDYSYLKDVVYQVYENNPNALQFNEDDTAILKMDFLYSDISEDKPYSYIDPIYNKDFDQCAGYIIVEKNKTGGFDIDVSHCCDMLDY